MFINRLFKFNIT